MCHQPSHLLWWKIEGEGGIFHSLHEKQEGELIFLLMLLQKLRAYLVIVLKEVKCSVCQEGVWWTLYTAYSCLACHLN